MSKLDSIITTVEGIIGVVPQLSQFEGDVELGVKVATELYHKVQLLFGHDLFPDKTDAQIAEMGAQTWDQLAAKIAAERARLLAEQNPAPPSPPPAPESLGDA